MLGPVLGPGTLAETLAGDRMARNLHKLTARAAAAIDKPGRHSDGGGLYLNVSKDGRRRWVFLYRWGGKLKEMGLGSARDVTLASARQLAADARKTVATGTDPISARRARQVEAIEAAGTPTFGTFADDLIDKIEGGFRNEKHRAQWRTTLGEAYCKTIRKKPVDEIDTADVLSVLQPIWLTKSETASRIRGRIERVLDAAKAAGHRTGENPARFRGHLDHLLPKRPKLTRGHHAALPYAEAAAFFARLTGERDSVSSRALAFTILTAARSGETMGARWREFDLTANVWTVPGERMKAGREHRVPLTAEALAVLAEVAALAPEGRERADAFVFPGARKGKPLSVMAMTMSLRDLDASAFTVHGFRSTFRDWAGEETDHAREVIEAALSHTVGDQVERAYRRGDALEKRRALMADWGRFLASTKAVKKGAPPKLALVGSD